MLTLNVLKSKILGTGSPIIIIIKIPPEKIMILQSAKDDGAPKAKNGKNESRILYKKKEA